MNDTLCFRVDSVDENDVAKVSLWRNALPNSLVLTTTTNVGQSSSMVDMSCLTDMIDEKTVPIYQGATASAAGVTGTVPPAASAERDSFLKGDGTWEALPTNHVTTDTAQTITASKTFSAGLYGNVVAMSAGAIDVSAGTVFTKTIAANTTISFTNVPAAPATACVTLILTNGGSKTVTWPSSVKWSGGSAPDLTASGVDVLTFLTVNGGTTWYGTVNSLGAA